MANTQRLEETLAKISELTSGLSARHLVKRTETREARGRGDEGRNFYGTYEAEVEELEPDEIERRSASQNLNRLVMENQDLIPSVLQRLEQSQLSSEYIEIFRRFRNSEELVKLTRKPLLSQQFRDNIALRITSDPNLVSGEFAESYYEIKSILDPKLFSQPSISIDLTTRLQKKDPLVITFIYNHPNSWIGYHFPFNKFGKAAIPPLLEAITSSTRLTYIKAHAATELQQINDPETNKKLISMIKKDNPNLRYVAKALVRSNDSGKIDPFILHHKKIDYMDWRVGLSTKEAIPRLIEILINPNSPIILKDKTIQLLKNFKGYETDRISKKNIPVDENYPEYGYGRVIPNSAEVSEEQYKRVLDYYSQRGYLEKDRRTILIKDGSLHFEDLLIHLRVNGQEKGFVDLFNLFRNPSNPQQLRLRVAQRIGEIVRQYYQGERHPIDKVYHDTKDYLGKIGSRLFGWRREPDKDIRIAAREAYYNFY